jgi:hypothetical protein
MERFRRPERPCCGNEASAKIPNSARWTRRLAGCVALLTLVTCLAQTAQQNPNQSPQKPIILPEANRLPDANEQMKMREKKDRQLAYDALNMERKKRIADDSAQLVTLAMALKAEEERTADGKLTPNMLRKAAEIEKLAHDVKEKMKVTVD